MTCADRLILAQGTTFARVYRYGAEPLVYKTIGAKTADTPLTLTVTGHGLPAAWPVALTDVGYDDLNADAWPPGEDDWLEATTVDADTVKLNDVDLDRFEDGTWNDGTIAYLTPVDLAGASATLTLYDGAGDVALEVTGTLDNTAKTITFTIDADDSTDFAVGDYTYAAQFTDSVGAVAVLDEGALTVYTPGSPP